MKTITINAYEWRHMCAELITNAILANIKKKEREAVLMSASKEA